MANEKRLIDANAFIERIEERLKNEIIIGWLCSIVDEAPTVDAVEVVHGRWRFCGSDRWNDAYVCSECGKMAMDNSKYCPNCGAKMDGGKDQ